MSRRWPITVQTYIKCRRSSNVLVGWLFNGTKVKRNINLHANLSSKHQASWHDTLSIVLLLKYVWPASCMSTTQREHDWASTYAMYNCIDKLLYLHSGTIINSNTLRVCLGGSASPRCKAAKSHSSSIRLTDQYFYMKIVGTYIAHVRYAVWQ